MGTGFFDTIKHQGNYYDIYLNPTEKDIDQVIKQNHFDKSFRFLAYPESKRLYIFSTDILHEQIEKVVKVDIASDLVYRAVATKKGGKWTVKFTRNLGLLLDGKLDWLEGYGFGIKEAKSEASKFPNLQIYYLKMIRKHLLLAG